MRKFINEIGIAFNGYGQSFRAIRECKLQWVFLVPLALLIVNIYWGGNAAFYLTANITEWIREVAPFSMGDSWWAGTIRTLSSFLVWVSIFLVAIYVGGFLLLALLSPILAYVSERVDEHITHKKYPFRLSEFVADIFRGIRLAFRNLFIELALVIAGFFVGLIPVVGMLVPLVLLVVAAYFYGFSFLDYTLERRRYSFRQSIAKVRMHKSAAFGLGAIYMILTAIPFIGFALAGFAAIVSVVAATIAANKLLETEQ